MCCRPIYSERRFSPLGRASRGHTGGRPIHRRFLFFICFGSPPSFCGACLFFFYREKGSALSLPSSTAKSNFVYPTTKSLSTVGCSARKTPRSLRDLNPRPNRQKKVTRLPTQPPGRPVQLPRILLPLSNMIIITRSTIILSMNGASRQ